VSDPDEAAQDAAWQEIVANFGERAELSDDDLAVPEAPDLTHPVFGDDVDEPFAPDADAYSGEDYSGDYGGDYSEDYDEYEFVPPRPSLPHPSPDRLFAWLGVLGAPVVAVALFVLHATLGWYVPTWVVDLLVIAFLGGFGYLVFLMPREPRDPWDDGARL
jgi:hypothetical protein